jgi:hypothetical protein
VASASTTNQRRRLSLASRIPDEEAWARLPTASQRALAETLLQESIEVIGSDGREPDNWEALELRCAIDALDQQLYASMLVFIGRALMPVPDRKSFLGYRREAVASLEDLRSAFVQALCSSQRRRASS